MATYLRQEDRKRLQSTLDVDYKGGIFRGKRYEDAPHKHRKVENAIYDIYKEIGDATPIPVKDIEHGFRVPDLALAVPNVDRIVVLEIKTNMSDAKSALHQCRRYSMNGFYPYIAVASAHFEGGFSELYRTVNEFEYNSPGFITFDSDGTLVKCHPKYEQ